MRLRYRVRAPGTSVRGLEIRPKTAVEKDQTSASCSLMFMKRRGFEPSLDAKRRSFHSDSRTGFLEFLHDAQPGARHPLSSPLTQQPEAQMDEAMKPARFWYIPIYSPVPNIFQAQGPQSREDVTTP